MIHVNVTVKEQFPEMREFLRREKPDENYSSTLWRQTGGNKWQVDPPKMRGKQQKGEDRREGKR